MFDGMMKRHLDPTMDRIANVLAFTGVTANVVTVVGFVMGMAGAAAVALDRPLLGLALFLAGRVADGLDGAIARRQGVTDFGGFLDIVLDFAVYASFVLAFAIRDPSHALSAAILLASFYVTGSAFLAMAVLGAKQRRTSRYGGRKSIYYTAGITEGFETIVALSLMAVFPVWFPVIAAVFTLMCLASGVARVIGAIPSVEAAMAGKGRGPVRLVDFLDSIAEAGPSQHGRVVVTGSHGGRSAADYATSAGVAALVFNDAGGGRDGAGLQALDMLGAHGIAGVAVSHGSARIGDARSTYEDGKVSALNEAARQKGVTVGMRTAAAVEQLIQRGTR